MAQGVFLWGAARHARSYLGKGNHMSERITGHTELIGLMAYPIRHSASPAMHNEAFAELGCDYAYLAFEVGADEIEAGVQAIRTLKMRGSNISMPNKTLVGEYLDELTPAAKMCGAVNTVVNDNGHFIGTITDGVGFMQAAADNGINPIGKKMTIVGCGGAGTAIQIQAALDGVSEISIFNRKDDFYHRGEETVQKINSQTSCKATLYDLADLQKLKEELNEVLKTLSDREARVLRLRFGLDDGRTRTLEEVGKEFNVTRERIRQIEAKALRKLRHPNRIKKLKDYT